MSSSVFKQKYCFAFQFYARIIQLKCQKVRGNNIFMNNKWFYNMVWSLQGDGVVIWVDLSRNISGLSITVLCFLTVTSGNLVIPYLHAWGNMPHAYKYGINGVSGNEPVW